VGATVVGATVVGAAVVGAVVTFCVNSLTAFLTGPAAILVAVLATEVLQAVMVNTEAVAAITAMMAGMITDFFMMISPFSFVFHYDLCLFVFYKLSIADVLQQNPDKNHDKIIFFKKIGAVALSPNKK
jgi:hypothetical protein